MSKGVISMGLRAPIIKQGDNIVDIVVNTVLNELKISHPNELLYDIEDKDVIGITESVVARALGIYVKVDDIVQFMEEHGFSKNLVLIRPIMSRNRFAIILKGLARFANSIIMVVDEHFDDQGNPTFGINQFTGVDIQKYYSEICANEGCTIQFRTHIGDDSVNLKNGYTFIDCRCHPVGSHYAIDLSYIMNQPVFRKDGTRSQFNTKYGLLGSNKADEETLKLFPEPTWAQQICEEIQQRIHKVTGKTVEVMVYGDGCFKDPVGGIWEFADPVVSPAYTKGLEGTPNEIKIKAFADDKYKDFKGENLNEAIKLEIRSKNNDLVGNMASQGTTPRRYVDLLGSLMDLTSGSGDKGTPIIYIKNYFKNYSDN